MVQILLQKLPPGQIGRPPEADVAGDQQRVDTGYPEQDPQHHKDAPLHQHQGIDAQPAGEIIHQSRQQQGQQAGPQQRNIGIVVGPGGQYGDQLSIRLTLNRFDRGSHFVLFSLGQKGHGLTAP